MISLEGGGSLVQELRTLMALYNSSSGSNALADDAAGSTMPSAAAVDVPLRLPSAVNSRTSSRASTPPQLRPHAQPTCVASHEPPALDADTGATSNSSAAAAVVDQLSAATTANTAIARRFSHSVVPLVSSSRRSSVQSTASRLTAAAVAPPLAPSALLEGLSPPSSVGTPSQSHASVVASPQPAPSSGTGSSSSAGKGLIAADREAADEAAVAAAWLCSLGLGVGCDAHKLAQELGPTSPCATSFTDGLLLAAVVEHCEDRSGLRRALIGLDRSPRTGAAKLSNIRRVLEVLREHRAMPLTHLWSELALRDGDPMVVRQLLLQIRKAYGQHLQVKAAPPAHTAAGAGHGE